MEQDKSFKPDPNFLVSRDNDSQILKCEVEQKSPSFKETTKGYIFNNTPNEKKYSRKNSDPSSP